MQAAADATEGSMVSIIGLDEDKVRQLCDEARQGELLEPVNFNCPGQIVVSGSLGACERAETLAPKYGAAKAVRLEVAGAFHTTLMSSAAEALRKALLQSRISQPAAGQDHRQYQRRVLPGPRTSVVAGLTRQLTGAILWQKCMERLLAEGVEEFYEIGPGQSPHRTDETNQQKDQGDQRQRPGLRESRGRSVLTAMRSALPGRMLES